MRGSGSRGRWSLSILSVAALLVCSGSAGEGGLRGGQDDKPAIRVEGGAIPSVGLPSPRSAPVDSQNVASGTFVDPLGQSDILHLADRIEISVPAGAYDLSIELGQITAPRLLRPVEGDFLAEVTVDPIPSPGLASAGQPRRGYHGAGLLLWLDERTYVRLESAVYRDEEEVVRYALFEVRLEGALVGGLSRADHRLRDEPAQLQLERREQMVRALVRQNEEEEWVEVGRVEVDLPREVQVGLAAVNTATTPLRATFRTFGLTLQDIDSESRPLPPALEPPRQTSEAPTTDYDSPPKPVRVIRPEYPRAARSKKTEGTVVVEILIDTSGRVVRGRIIESVPGLDDAALRCVMNWEFEPAVKNGKPVACIAHAPVTFRLK